MPLESAPKWSAPKYSASKLLGRNAHIAAEYREGHLMQDIAGHYGISRARVQQILSDAGIRGADGGLARRMAERAKRRNGK